MLQKFQNVDVENITLTPHSVVLLKHHVTVSKNTTVNTTINTVTIEGLKNDKPITVVRLLLSALLAERRTKTLFDNSYKVVKDDSGKIVADNSGIQGKRVITPFLSGTTIYYTDKEGKIKTGFQLKGGMKLRDTALNIRQNHAIISTSGDILKACIYNQAKAIIAQSTYLEDINAIKDAILKELETEKAEKKAKKETVKETEKAA